MKYKEGERVLFEYKGIGDKKSTRKTGKIINIKKGSQPYEVHTSGSKYYFLNSKKPKKKSMSYGYIIKKK